MNNSWTRPVILRKDVDKIKESVKIGDKFIYKTIYKDVDDGTVRPKIERVAVVVNAKRPGHLKSMTYIEILFQKMGLNY